MIFLLLFSQLKMIYFFVSSNDFLALELHTMSIIRENSDLADFSLL